MRRPREGAARRSSTVSSNNHPEIVMQWSDQHHLVLGTISPQFQDQFLPTSLSPVLRTVEHGEARVVTTVWSPRSSLLTPGGSSASTNSSGDMAQNRV